MAALPKRPKRRATARQPPRSPVPQRTKQSCPRRRPMRRQATRRRPQGLLVSQLVRPSLRATQLRLRATRLRLRASLLRLLARMWAGPKSLRLGLRQTRRRCLAKIPARSRLAMLQPRTPSLLTNQSITQQQRRATSLATCLRAKPRLQRRAHRPTPAQRPSRRQLRQRLRRQLSPQRLQQQLRQPNRRQRQQRPSQQRLQRLSAKVRSMQSRTRATKKSPKPTLPRPSRHGDPKRTGRVSDALAAARWR